MNNITPSTNLYLLRGVPITNNYKDTLYFASKSAQHDYFWSKRIQTYSDFTYQRVDSGKVRVALGAESCYPCNYLMFQNENFGTKWFYAFITGVEYVNNGCTEITYEIDKIQTWFFDLTLKPCMVIRQHSITDGVYVNCEPENFADDAKYVSWEQDAWEGNCFVSLTTGHWVDATGSTLGYWEPSTTYHLINNIPCPLELNYFLDNDAGRRSLVTYIQKIVANGHEQDIVAVFCASGFNTTITEGVPTYLKGESKANLRSGAFQGYQPQNMKMYNFPFCKFVVKSPTAEKTYCIEDFRTGTGTTQTARVEFRVYATLIPSPELLIVPLNYRGETDAFENGILITDFPYVPIVGDTYQMWCVQNNGGYMANTVGQIGGFGMSALTLDPVGMFIGARQTIQEGANWIGQNINATARPDNVYGLQKGNIMSNIKKNGFTLECVTYDYWKARQVDTYFTMYGYAENHVMVPNINARRQWTYVQTTGCTLVGNAPSDDISFIEDCFNNGITWWVHPENVGNYNIPNRPYDEQE